MREGACQYWLVASRGASSLPRRYSDICFLHRGFSCIWQSSGFRQLVACISKDNDLLTPLAQLSFPPMQTYRCEGRVRAALDDTAAQRLEVTRCEEMLQEAGRKLAGLSEQLEQQQEQLGAKDYEVTACRWGERGGV